MRRTRSALGIRGGDGVKIWGRRGQEGMLGSHSLLNTKSLQDLKMKGLGTIHIWLGNLLNRTGVTISSHTRK